MGYILSDDSLVRLGNLTLSVSNRSGKFKDAEALLIWQYVRHNRKYIEEYSRLKKHRNKADEMIEDFCSSWQMSIPLDPQKPYLPKGFFFGSALVYRFSDEKRLKVFWDWMTKDEQANFEIVLINRTQSKKLILSSIEKLLNLDKTKVVSSKGSALTHLGTNFICYYLSTVCNLSGVKLIKKYNSLVPHSKLQYHQIKKKNKSFLEISQKSPIVFYNAATR